MSDDAVLLQGRQTKRKWKNILILMAVSMFFMAGAWAATHSRTLWDSAKALWARIAPGNAGQWVTTDFTTNARAFVVDHHIFFTEAGTLAALKFDGTVSYREVTGLEAPQVVFSQSTAALFTPGDNRLLRITDKGIQTWTIPSGVDAAAVSDRGDIAVITAGSGYDTVTEWYDTDGQLLHEIGLQHEAMALATFLHNGHTLAACTISDAGAWHLRLYEDAQFFDIPLDVSEVYDLKPCGDGLAVWSCEGLFIFSSTGELSAILEFAPEELLLWDSDSFAAAILLDAGAPTLVTMDNLGNIFRSAPLLRIPKSLSVSGGCLCVLDREALLIYDKQCLLQDSVPDGAFAFEIQAIPGGAAIFGDCEFMRYISQ